MISSIERERARYSLNRIREVKEKDYEGKYRSYVRRAPALILANGLGNTLAFWKSKKEEKAYDVLYNQINEWFQKHENSSTDLLEWVISDKTSSLDVFRETKEILAFLSWMKRFAESELKGEEK